MLTLVELVFLYKPKHSFVVPWLVEIFIPIATGGVLYGKSGS
jgi:hypothetical protein